MAPMAGVHRDMGTHISRTKSIRLDTWKREWLVALVRVGNVRAAAVWEGDCAAAESRRPPIDAGSNEANLRVRKPFLRAKYEKRAFLREAGVVPPVRQQPSLQSPRMAADVPQHVLPPSASGTAAPSLIDLGPGPIIGVGPPPMEPNRRRDDLATAAASPHTASMSGWDTLDAPSTTRNDMLAEFDPLA